MYKKNDKQLKFVRIYVDNFTLLSFYFLKDSKNILNPY